MRIIKTPAHNIIEGDTITTDLVSGLVVHTERKLFSRYITVLVSPKRSNKIHRVILDKTQHVIISK